MLAARSTVIGFACLALAASRGAHEADMLEPGTLPDAWPTGAHCPEPDFQSREYNADFVILRQSGCTNFEKPFLYLVFGTRVSLLVDSGAKGADAAAAVTAARAGWAARHGGRTLPLIVVHSHGHGDHVAGDAALSKLPDTRVVAASPAAVQTFIGIRNWPNDRGTLDLGDRVMDVLPIPGHEPASIAIYDRRTGILLTGDTLYPGRLYVRDGPAFTASVARLVAFTDDRPVAHILGAHIEQSTTPFVDYKEGTTSQPDEHPLALGRAHLLELHAALQRMNGTIAQIKLRDFTIVPVRPATGR